MYAERRLLTSMAIKIAMANQKGGAGKTTTAICVAQELRRRKKKVLFIDCDPQCNSTGFYEAVTEGRETLMDILCGDIDAIKCIQKTEKGDIIASDPELYDAETIVRVNELRFSHLRNSCRGLDEDYDYIIMDTTPTLGVILKNVLHYADWIVIPVEESGWSMAGLMSFSDALEMAKGDNPELRVAGVLTIKIKPRTRKSGRMGLLADDIAEKLGTRRFHTRIRESVACSEALTEYFVPLHEYAPKSTTYEDYRAFTKELEGVVRNVKR